MSEKPHWTGTLRKGLQPNTIEGEMVDAWGWKVRLEATRTDSGYELRAFLGETPDALRIPMIDGEKK